jgi:hypothetical protein
MPHFKHGVNLGTLHALAAVRVSSCENNLLPLEKGEDTGAGEENLR